MDQLTLSLLTIAVNALITYFLLKRQENRYAKILFEDQVKFKMIHEKRVETLENLYKKFVVFNKTLEKVIRDLLKHNSSTTTKGMLWVWERDLKPFEDQAEKLAEVNNYFEDNRIFLPDNVVKLVSEIISNARFPYMLVTSLYFFLSEVRLEEHKLLELFARLINNNIDTYGRDMSKIDSDHPDLVKMFDDIVFRMHAYTRTLEDTYKSVADSDYK